MMARFVGRLPGVSGWSAYLQRMRELPKENAELKRRLQAKNKIKERLTAEHETVKQLTEELRLARSTSEEAVIANFHRVFYDRGTWKEGTWAGVPILKNPLDLFLYQELVFRRRPKFIVELGANLGGSTLFFAHMLDLIGEDGRVLSVSIDDNWQQPVRDHPRIETFSGSSTDPAIVEEIHRRVPAGSPCLVNLDSDHRKDHVLAELRAYADLPAAGDYIVVEDGNVNGHPVKPGHGPGPYEAVEAFLASDDRLEQDTALEERYLVTFAVKGFLRRRTT